MNVEKMTKEEILIYADSALEGAQSENPGEYRWVMGVEVCKKLANTPINLADKTKKLMMFGIEVQPEFRDVWCIELWKKVRG